MSLVLAPRARSPSVEKKSSISFSRSRLRFSASSRARSEFRSLISNIRCLFLSCSISCSKCSICAHRAVLDSSSLKGAAKHRKEQCWIYPTSTKPLNRLPLKDLLLDSGLVGNLLFPQLLLEFFHQTAEREVSPVSVPRCDDGRHPSGRGNISILAAGCTTAAQLHGLTAVLLRARVRCYGSISCPVAFCLAVSLLPSVPPKPTAVLCRRLASRVWDRNFAGGGGPGRARHAQNTAHTRGRGDVVVSGESLWGASGVPVPGGPLARWRAPVSPQRGQAIYEPVTSTSRRYTGDICRRAATAALLGLVLGARCRGTFERVFPGGGALGLFTRADERLSFSRWRSQFWPGAHVWGLGGSDGCTQFGVQRWGAAVHLLVGVGDRAVLEVFLRDPGAQTAMLRLMPLDRELCQGSLLLPPWVQTDVFPNEDGHQVLDQGRACGSVKVDRITVQPFTLKLFQFRTVKLKSRFYKCCCDFPEWKYSCTLCNVYTESPHLPW